MWCGIESKVGDGYDEEGEAGVYVERLEFRERALMKEKKEKREAGGE